MSFRLWFLELTLGAALGLAAAEQAAAELLRLRYLPDPCGNTTLVPVGPGGALGEKRVWIGGDPKPYHCQLRATHIVTFRHPATCCNVAVPLNLLEGSPRIEHRSDRIIYNYGSYTVTARFLPDGSVETIYNSGMLRPLPFN